MNGQAITRRMRKPSPSIFIRAHAKNCGREVRRVHGSFSPALFSSLRAFDKIPEGDRVSQAIHWRNAVFPLRPRGAGKQISGARLGDEIDTLPFSIVLSAEPETARREQRDADDL